MSAARLIVPRTELPVLWAFEESFPEHYRPLVREGLGVYNQIFKRGPLFEERPPGTAGMPLQVTPGLPVTREERTDCAVVEYALDDDDQCRWAWSRLLLFPRWFQMNRLVLGVGGDARRINHIVHEGFHLLGAVDEETGGHSSNLLAITHRRFGWWPIRRGLNGEELAELRRVYGP